MRRIPLLSAAVLCLFCVLAGAQATRPPAAPVPPAPKPTATVGALSRIEPPPESHRLTENQTLVYEVEWRLFTAGTATLRVESVGSEKRVAGTADATGVVELLYHVQDRFESRFDPRTFCSHSVSKHTEEGRRQLDTRIRFDYTRGKSMLDETNQRTHQSKHQESDIPGCVTDVLSSIFYVGSLPLPPDANYTFPLNDGGKTVDVRVVVEAREELKLPAGTYKTIRVQPEASAGVIKDKGKIWVWYSDDEQRLPVQMRARMFWGTLTLRLQRIDKK